MSEGTFFMIMFTVASVIGLATVVYIVRHAFSGRGGEIGGWELRGARQRLYAVAKTAIAEGLRAKVASGFAILILVAIPVFFLTADGDGTIKGRVQMFVSYSVGFSVFVLSILTVLFGCRSLSAEIAARQIYGIVTKPIPRWQIVVGKWLGVMVVVGGLLVLAGAMTYGGTLLMVHGFRADLEHDLQTYGSLTPSQASASISALDDVRGVGKEGMESPVVTALAGSLGWTWEEVGDMLIRLPEPTRVNLRRFDELRRQVLVARTSITAQLPDFTEAVDEGLLQLREEQRMPEGWSTPRVRREIERGLRLQFCTVEPGEGRQWVLQGPEPQKGKDLVMSIRFKMRAPKQPLAERIGGRVLETDKVLCYWGVGDPRKAAFLESVDQYPINMYYEVEIPQQGVEPDGKIILLFQNIDPRSIPTVFDIANGDLEVLYRVGSWELSLVEALLAALIPLACLASFAICASTFLSFPVGVLICLVLFVISSSNAFLAESLAVTDEYAPPQEQRKWDYQLRRVTLAGMTQALAIGDVDPVRHLLEGRAVGWGLLWSNTWKFVLLKSGIVLIVAVIVFRRRELAAVIV